jgi:hypothetical protein
MNPHGTPHDASDDDGINVKKIIAVGAVSLFIFAVSALIAHLIMRNDLAKLEAGGLPPKPAAIGREEIGIVDQVEFEGDHRLEDWRNAKKKRLNSYGWSDRNRQLIHIPINQAIEELIGQTASTSGSPP